MSFLAARDQLPLAPVTSAGTCVQNPWKRLLGRLICPEAQCLYVLTDDNYPAISDIKADASYISCLLSIARQASTSNDSRTVTLSVLAAGKNNQGCPCDEKNLEH